MACSKDLHSVYIDNEMPEEFISEYENIVKNDSKSASELEHFQKIHEILHFDAVNESSKISDDFVNESFKRLQSKMKYANTVKFTEKKKSLFTIPLSLGAVAAALAVVFVPSYLKVVNQNQNVEIKAIAHSELQPIAESDVKIDGTIHSEKLPEIFAAVAKSDDDEKSVDSVNSVEIEQKTIRASSVVSNTTRNFGSKMTSVDVFRPRFENNDIKIRVPEIGEIMIEN